MALLSEGRKSLSVGVIETTAGRERLAGHQEKTKMERKMES